MGISEMTDAELKEYRDLYIAGLKKSRRFELYKFHLFDVKFAYHLIRLFDQAQQLLETGEMDLQRAKEAMKAVRRGEWTLEQVIEWSGAKERELEIAFTNCKLPAKADEPAIRQLLLNCLEHHYGSLSDCVVNPDAAVLALRNIQAELEKVKNLI